MERLANLCPHWLQRSGSDEVSGGAKDEVATPLGFGMASLWMRTFFWCESCREMDLFAQGSESTSGMVVLDGADDTGRGGRSVMGSISVRVRATVGEGRRVISGMGGGEGAARPLAGEEVKVGARGAGTVAAAAAAAAAAARVRLLWRGLLATGRGERRGCCGRATMEKGRGSLGSFPHWYGEGMTE